MDSINALVHILAELQATLDLGAHLARLAVDAGRAAGVYWTGFVLGTTNMSGSSGTEFTGDATIRRFEPYLQGLADAALAPIVMWAFYRVMFAHGMFTQYTARIILPRVVVAAAFVNFCLPLVQGAVDLDNALSLQVVRMASANLDLPHQLLSWAADAGPAPGLGPLISLAVVAGFLLLGIAYVVRYALLVLLAILSPLAAVGLVLPETEHYAREWSNLFVATLLMQPLQLLVLVVALGMQEHDRGLLRQGFVLAGLWICFKVPGALHSASSVGTHAHALAKHQAMRLAKVAARAAAI